MTETEARLPLSLQSAASQSPVEKEIKPERSNASATVSFLSFGLGVKLIWKKVVEYVLLFEI